MTPQQMIKNLTCHAEDCRTTVTKNIFLSDCNNNAVHVFSVNGQYHCQLLSSLHIKNKPSSQAVDKERQLLYVGQDNSVVGVFKLNYE